MLLIRLQTSMRHLLQLLEWNGLQTVHKVWLHSIAIHHLLLLQQGRPQCSSLDHPVVRYGIVFCLQPLLQR